MRDDNAKVALLALALFGWAKSSSKRKAASTEENSSTDPTDKDLSRPQEAKPAPGPLVRLDPQSPTKATSMPTKKAEGKTPTVNKPIDGSDPKGRKPRKKRSIETDDTIAQLSRNILDIYIERGIEPEIAATEALTVYLLAGGADVDTIRAYQKQMGVEESGYYDKETSTAVASRLDAAIDGAINLILQLEFSGESPEKAAGQALLQYLDEARDIPAAVPREKIAALQLAMGVRPGGADGRYNQDTLDRLVELGLTPVPHTIDENQMVIGATADGWTDTNPPKEPPKKMSGTEKLFWGGLALVLVSKLGKGK